MPQTDTELPRNDDILIIAMLCYVIFSVACRLKILIRD